MTDAAKTVVGGPQAGQDNTIAAREYGVRVVGPQAATNQVEGNIVEVIEESESEGDRRVSSCPCINWRNSLERQLV